MGSRNANRRLKALTVVAAASFFTGVAQGSRYVSPESKAAARFASAWERNDYRTMYRSISGSAQAATSFQDFVVAYRRATETATVKSLQIKTVQEKHAGEFLLQTEFNTRIFGTVVGKVTLPISQTDGKAAVAWRPHLAFPYLRPGTTLKRETQLPPRAAILARDGTPLAQGPTRSSAPGIAVSQLVGALGPIPTERSIELKAAGVPTDATVGISGLELTLDRALLGQPGGKLIAGNQTVATTEPKSAQPLKTTIDPKLQSAAEVALAGRYGGIAVIKPNNGEILALAGIASSVLQPPGSTFKIITLATALKAKIVKPSTSFPYLTAAMLEGVPLSNANGESCGGTLINSFAESCNSVFAPLGAKVGAEKLVAMAELFGFNEPPPFQGAATSAIPQANLIGDDLAVGSSAIGQGQVQATPLQMASVAATIAAKGKRFRPTLLKGKHAVGIRVITPKVARTIERMMAAVVNYGTGRSAAIPGIQVAGKTGTAELESQSKKTEDQTADNQTDPSKQEQPKPPDTDAWFTSYASTKKPRVAVAVMLVHGGAGGDTAAPAARQVLLSALGK